MSFVGNHKYGCFLNNHCHVGEDYMANAVPFYPTHDAHDELISPVTKSSREILKISKYCKRINKMENGTKTYELSSSKFGNLFQKLIFCAGSISSHHILFSAKDKCIRQYVVKVVQVNCWRDAYTSMKELYMTNAIYNSKYLSCKGSDIVCKPFYGCLFWSGKKWKYLSVYEKANGFTVSQINRQRIFNREYNKEQVILSVSNALQTLWMLGFAHNNIHDANVVYDFNNRTAKITNFAMAVRLPNHVTASIQNCLYSKKLDTVKISKSYCEFISTTYAMNAKLMAVSILSLSKDICYINTDEDGFIYNTDDKYLWSLYNMLS